MSAHKPDEDVDRHLFAEINKLRQPEKDEEDIEYEQEWDKMNSTIFARIATNKVFEGATLITIVVNAAYIGIDAEWTARGLRGDDLYDTESTPLFFPIMEWIFAIYFTVEVVIRFLAFKRKCCCWCDMWFVFDSILVGFMVIETWILPLFKSSGPLSQLSVLRLLRLLRMVKFMRFIPELQIIVKGMIASIRAVACTALLQVLLLYVFGIFFTTIYHQGDKPNDDEDLPGSAVLFGSMGKSMRTLFIMGTILDDVTAGTNVIRSSKNSWIMLPVFLIFILISSFTMLNMLVGILCEVVAATSEGETAKTMEANIRDAIHRLFQKMDRNKDGYITREELLTKSRCKGVIDALRDLDIKQKHFNMYADLLLPSGEAQNSRAPLNHETLTMMVMRLRPGASVSALDFASFKNEILKNYVRLRNQVSRVEQKCTILRRQVACSQAGQESSPTSVSTPEPLLPAASQPVKITVSTLPQLERTSDAEILEELQRRVGWQDMDLGLSNKVAAAPASGRTAWGQ